MTPLPVVIVQLTWTAHTAASLVNYTYASEAVVSYLPLSHVAAQMFDMWIGMTFAATIYFAEPDALKVKTSAATQTCKNLMMVSYLDYNPVFCFVFFCHQGSLATTLKEVRPTYFLGVPRVWEKMQEKMKVIGAKASPMRKRVADWAKSIGLQYNYSAMNR